MEQVRSLESLVNDVIAEMERRGNADNTIVRHKRAYSQFCEYAQSKGQEYYSSDLTKAFLAEKEKLLPCRGPRFMEQYHIALNKLSDAAQGQELYSQISKLLAPVIASIPFKSLKFVFMGMLSEPRADNVLLVTHGGLPITRI